MKIIDVKLSEIMKFLENIRKYGIKFPENLQPQ